MVEQKDGPGLRHHLHIPRLFVNSDHCLGSQSGLQRPRQLSTLETYDSGNVRSVTEMEKQVKDKMTGYIPSSLRSSVDNVVNLLGENTFSSNADHLQDMSASSFELTKSRVTTSMSALNGDDQSPVERSNSSRSASSRVRKSPGLSSTYIQPASSSARMKSSSSEVSDGQTEATGVLLRSRSVTGSAADGKGHSGLIVQKVQPSVVKVNGGIASADTGESARRNYGVTNSHAHQLPHTRNTTFTETSGLKQLTSSGVRNVMNETVVVENVQSTMAKSLSDVRLSSEPIVVAEANQTELDVAFSKLIPAKKSVSGIPDSKLMKLGTSRIPAGSRRQRNRPGNLLTVESSGRREARLSMSSSCSDISSQSAETKARASVSDTTRRGIPKPAGMFCK